MCPKHTHCRGSTADSCLQLMASSTPGLLPSSEAAPTHPHPLGHLLLVRCPLHSPSWALPFTMCSLSGHLLGFHLHNWCKFRLIPSLFSEVLWISKCWSSKCWVSQFPCSGYVCALPRPHQLSSQPLILLRQAGSSQQWVIFVFLQRWHISGAAEYLLFASVIFKLLKQSPAFLGTVSCVTSVLQVWRSSLWLSHGLQSPKEKPLHRLQAAGAKAHPPCLGGKGQPGSAILPHCWGCQ